MGVEISKKYLSGLLPDSELDGSGRGGYVLGVQKEGRLEPFLKTGGMAAKGLNGQVEPLKLYKTNTPFEDNVWVVVGVARNEMMFGMGSQIVRDLTIAILLALPFWNNWRPPGGYRRNQAHPLPGKMYW